LKFIVDQQLPPLLAAWLRQQGFDALHTRELDRRDASDDEIWAAACADAATVISKDEDFVQLQTVRGGAALVWVRIGNCDNPTLIAHFERAWPNVVESLELGVALVEVR
jgi:predicted nuclease of predicted toxin-antitoxin system